MKEMTSEDGYFYCTHISLGDRDEIIEDFKSRDDAKGLELYLKEYAYEDETEHYMRTYIVKGTKTKEIVAYFSLKAGLISIGSTEKVFIDTYPGVEIANFSMNKKYIEKHPYAKGIGIKIFREFMIPIIKEVAKSIGVKIIYIFSIPKDKVISNYYKYDFRRLEDKFEKDLHKRIKPGYDKDCIFMYQVLN